MPLSPSLLDKLIWKIRGAHNRLLLRVFFRWKVSQIKNKRPDFFFVQIGANNGQTNDPLYQVVTKFHLRGLCVEPLPSFFETLKRNYEGYPRVKFENTAIASTSGPIKLYRVHSQDGTLPKWCEGLGSFFSEVIKSHKNLVPDIERYLVEEQVQGMTFEELARKHQINRIDLLHVDTEGFDSEVLKQVFQTGFRPSLVLFEHKHLKAEEKAARMSALRQSGYTLYEGRDDILCVLKDKFAVN